MDRNQLIVLLNADRSIAWQHIAENLHDVFATLTEEDRELLTHITTLASGNGAVHAPARITVLLTCAQVYYRLGDGYNALRAGRQALTLAVLADVPVLRRRAHTVLGGLYKETGNLPSAFGHLSDALQWSKRLNDKIAECSTWVNLATTFHNTGRYGEAKQCSYRAIELANGSDHLHMVELRFLAHCNLAYTAWQMDDFETGFLAVRKAQAELGQAVIDSKLLERVLLMHSHVRLLLGTGLVEAAINEANNALVLAEQSKSHKAYVWARIAVALCVIKDKFAEGVNELVRLKKEARPYYSAFLDVLRSLVLAYRENNQHAEALKINCELYEVMGQSKDNVLNHINYMLRQENTQPPPIIDWLAATADLGKRLHGHRVGRLAALLAEDYGCDESTVLVIEQAARLHDVGHVVLSPQILAINEPDAIAHAHTVIGANMLAQIDHPVCRMAAEMARSHHERWDGGGYPQGLVGSNIPLGARIVALANTFDCALSNGFAVACSAINEHSNRFDPDLTAVFLRLLRRLHEQYGDRLIAHFERAGLNSEFMRSEQRVLAELVN